MSIFQNGGLAFKVTNFGGGTLSGRISLVAGAGFQLLDDGTCSRKAGESRAIGFRFVPTQAGPHRGSVMFNGAGPSHPVTGLAVAPAVRR